MLKFGLISENEYNWRHDIKREQSSKVENGSTVWLDKMLAFLSLTQFVVTLHISRNTPFPPWIPVVAALCVKASV